jgi:ion channel-forming bestrophin family protein
MIDYEPRRWLSLILSWRGAVLRMLLGRVAAAAAVGALAAWLYQQRGVHVPSQAHALVGVALGLLLVFRTNASYDRWWEGRRMFGMIVNRSRDLARQIRTFVDGDRDEDRAERLTLGRWLRLTYGLACQHLRHERDLAALGDLITADERARLAEVSCRPLHVLAWIGARLAARAGAGRLSEQRLVLLDANLTSYVDSFGAAERIMKTPVPFAYAQHIKTFLALFCFTLPFAIVDAMGWATPAVAAVVAFALFGIDEIGVEIEDPFGHDANDLPLDRIGATIATDVTALLATAGAAE